MNCDAATSLTRLSSATNNYSARLRWMVTKSSRATVISMAQEMAGLTSINGTTAELHPSRINRDSSDPQIQIQDSCDPFQNTTSEQLFNISSGKAASQPVQSCLLSIVEKGKERTKTSCRQVIQATLKSLSRTKSFKEECKASKRNPDKRIAALVRHEI